MTTISNLTQLGFIPKTSPARPTLVVCTVSTVTEQKLKLTQRGEWLKTMIANSEHDAEAKLGFERDLAALRSLYKSMVPDDVIQARCERLAALRQSLNIRITDNRQAYSRQTTSAVNALCGGAV